MRRALVLVVLLSLSVTITATAPLSAEEPVDPITVPPKGDEAQVQWDGVAPPGVNPTSRCPFDSSPSDEHVVTITAPAGGYTQLSAQATFKIEWDNADNDLILTVQPPKGKSLSSDGGSPEESLIITDPPSGDYTILVCGFAAVTPQPYKGTISIASGAIEPDLPTVPADGLQFSATVPADPQRDEAEPSVEIDRSGVIYTCGPSGASQQVDYAQVSTDGGRQFHLLGEAPRGQLSLGGGGDCAPATSPKKNEEGNHQFAYAGLNALLTFSLATSPDNGQTIAPNATSESNPGVDRQWTVFSDRDTVFLNYNQIFPRAITVQRSDNGGLTYGRPEVVSPDPDFPGQIRSLRPDQNPGGNTPAVYYPWNRGTQVLMAVSLDHGETWNNCLVANTPASTTAGFVTADHDEDGNVYIVYTEEADFHTYMVSLRNEDLSKCDGGTDDPDTFKNSVPGFTKPVQVDREKIRTTVFPWIAAGGKPGRVGVTFYGTESQGNPNTGEFKATWDVYVNQSRNALAGRNADFSQVKATTHPFHYDSICLNGLGCNLANPPGDRSLADFFSIEFNEATGQLALVYNQGAKKPDEAEGHVATPAFVNQVAGPSNAGGSLDKSLRQPVVARRTTDPAGDAIAEYSALGREPRKAKIAAADFRGVRVGPQVDPATGKPADGKGFTATMRVKDLSNEALNRALLESRSASLLWIFRYVDGFQSSALVARYRPGVGFTFGHNGYETTSFGCGSTGEKCLIYPGDNPIPGAADQEAGTITMSVPRDMLVGLAGPTGDRQRPREVPARAGTRFYDAAAFSLGDPTPELIEDFTDAVGDGGQAPNVESFLQPLDNTPARDFLLPQALVSGNTGPGDGPGGDGPGGDDGVGNVGDDRDGEDVVGGDPDGGPTLPATGGPALLALVGLVALVGGGWTAARRRR